MSSPKAEPFKLWLAQVGYERLEESEDPEKAIDRALKSYLAKGYSKDWINQRLKTIEVRKELTDEWEERGAKTGSDFAMLTNILTKEWSGLSVKEYKQVKGLKRENLRDNMTNIELDMKENIEVAKQGGSVAKIARQAAEAKIGQSVTSTNAQDLIAEKQAQQQHKDEIIDDDI